MLKKQVVFIMTDSQRQDMVGCYGNKEMFTPNLDKLASEGLRFSKAYTTQPVCGPARSALFTGLYPHSNGSWTNSYALGDNVKTIGQRLRDNGIHTAYIGKWHLDGGDYFGLGRCPDGWDAEYWYDMRNYLDEMCDEDRRWSRNTNLDQSREVIEEFTFGHKCSDKAIKFLQNNNQEDFFIVVSYDEPHDPGLCPEPYRSMYQDYCFPKNETVYDTLENKPGYQKVWAGNQLKRDNDSLKIKAPNLLGCNSYIDYEIGRVIRAIEENTPDAFIIYTSDHGDFLCSHALSGKGPAGYDEITKIPLIIKGRGIKENSIYDYPVSHINLMPTILEYMGVPIPKILEGVSI
ncbi:MAG: sulfatase-like hydrolase/transferase, partial [Oscillospiraceae bacterium]